MSGKSIKVGDKEINKSNFYKNKKLFKTEDIGITVKMAQLDTSLDIMMMMSLDHYV